VSALVAVAVIVCGGLASTLRYLVTLAIAGREPLPWAVLIVNVVGSSIGGAMLGFAVTAQLGADIRLVILTGVAGGLTTFSTFSVETLQLVTEGKWRSAIANVAANLVLGLGAAALAYGVVVGVAG
jgi:fluoride exporter